jgi:hypothetical protein
VPRVASCLGARERRSSIDAMTDWFARPVLHVSSVKASLRFYVDRLGFTGESLDGFSALLDDARALIDIIACAPRSFPS